MEISGFTNLGDLVKYMEDPLPSDPLKEMKASFNYEGFSHKNLEQASAYNENRPLKQLRTSYSSSSAASNISTTFHFLTPIFINPNNNQSKPISKQSSSSPHHLHSKLAAAHDHSLAERKRREKLSQRFVALSALLPGLKKMDKGSILEDAIEHMKRLEERVRMLEERANRRSNTIFRIKKEGGDGTDEKYSCQELEKYHMPLIRARFSEREVLIGINCEKKKGVLEKIVGEIERLNLSLASTSLMSYGDSFLTISIIIEKRDEEGMSVDLLVRNLQGVLKLL